MGNEVMNNDPNETTVHAPRSADQHTQDEAAE